MGMFSAALLVVGLFWVTYCVPTIGGGCADLYLVDGVAALVAAIALLAFACAAVLPFDAEPVSEPTT
jgi:hypothetical protein